MKSSRNFWRSLLFITLIAALCGAMAVPLLAPVHAAPAQANPLDVVINEVAWGGTAASATDEWIELYNPGPSTIDLSGWQLISTSDSSPTISLTGMIPSGGYYLLERTDDFTVSDIVADQIYTGDLANGGEILELRDDTLPTPNVIDTVNLNGGAWPAGSGASTYASMERINYLTADSDSNWASNDNITVNGLDANSNPLRGTPKQLNSATLALTPSPTPTETVTPTTTGTTTITPTSTISPTTTITPTRTTTPTPTLIPLPTLEILINEVAWAGTAASTSDEWIELYNPGATTINLAGWILKASDGTPTINLPSDDIPPGGYYLLERTDDTTVSDIPADYIYTGDMGNSNEVLQLFNPANQLVDTANSNSGNWPAGSSTTFGSMERRAVIADSDTAWITNTGVVSWGLDAGIPNNCTITPPCTTAPKPLKGTPKQANWATTVTATPSATPTRTKTPTKVPTASKTPTTAPAQLVAINEFVPRPGRDWNNDGLINTGDEFIELINHGTISVNLSGWTLDDEANTGSKPFVLPSRVLQPGERIVFYGSVTGLLLSDGGDGVRLLKPNGGLIDAFNYTVVNYPDQSFCRLPDNGGLDDWNRNCYPTPGLPNSLGSAPGASSGANEQLCPIADTQPLEFFLAECAPFGNNIWSRFYWDNTGWYGEMNLPNVDGKWDVFVD